MRWAWVVQSEYVSLALVMPVVVQALMVFVAYMAYTSSSSGVY
jgi:hypothetical protein